MDRPVVSPTPPGPVPGRQCWECQRRRLVCDAGQPFCRKCHTAGVVCPGYEDKKPLKWITPGRVTSRNRRARPKPKPKPKHETAPKKERASPPAPKVVKKEVSSPDQASDTKKAGLLTPPSHDDLFWTTPSSKGDVVVPFVDRHSIGSVSRFEMDSETCDIFQAVHYFNCQILPAWEAVHELAPNPYLVRFAPEVVPFLSRSMRHSLLCAAIDHRIYQIADNSNCSKWVTNLRPKQLYHRGIAIRTLSDAIANEEERVKDRTLTSLFLFFYIDFRQQPSCWRQHFNGLTQLMRLRGGPRHINRVLPAWGRLLIHYFIAGVTGNTTSPAHEQTETPYLVDHADLIAELYDDLGLSPSLLCPPTLFLDMLAVNGLRHQAATAKARVTEPAMILLDDPGATPPGSDAPADPDSPAALRTRAEDVLRRVLAFAPAAWVATVPSSGDGLELLAESYQSAVVLYAVASLQGVGVLPAASRALASLHAWHLARLLRLLRDGLGSPVLQPRIFTAVAWQLVVAGAQLTAGRAAGRADTLAADRAFVERQLALLSIELGSVVTLVAKSVLRRFWDSGLTEWDECFDRPWLFVG